ncbi:hypothetical protein V501_05674 [Pseudogymnoascus sp. VKM F-4519 (FW-2642)]|nr:hypothetical protein V501_05674 [Pseudogymnoascus sp. VKM F-4519 (FW-2642)]
MALLVPLPNRVIPKDSYLALDAFPSQEIPKNPKGISANKGNKLAAPPQQPPFPRVIAQPDAHTHSNHDEGTTNNLPGPPGLLHQEDPTNTPQLYLSLYLELVPLPALIQSDIIPVLPFWALVTFGSYLLFKLGLGVFTFNDVPAAHAELMLEIDEARADLRKKGVDVD